MDSTVIVSLVNEKGGPGVSGVNSQPGNFMYDQDDEEQIELDIEWLLHEKELRVTNELIFWLVFIIIMFFGSVSFW